MIPDGRDSVTCLSATVELSFGILLLIFMLATVGNQPARNSVARGLWQTLQLKLWAARPPRFNKTEDAVCSLTRVQIRLSTVKIETGTDCAAFFTHFRPLPLTMVQGSAAVQCRSAVPLLPLPGCRGCVNVSVRPASQTQTQCNCDRLY